MTACAACGHDNSAAAKFCEECGAPLAAAPPAQEQRKVVTVLFCDITGSTALGEQLDPETLRALLARYFEAMKTIVERHGGTVEKFIGDAVMAVFGVPTLHEDDALRAVRAAVEMREALPELGIQGRIGVTTGEVVTGTAERLATGDAVNLAARLEQAAQPGEVLIGESTFGLVAGVVDAEPVEPLSLKGKSEPVPAFRLLAITSEPVRRHGARMVGRARQQRMLAEAFASVVDDRSCQLFTVLGAAGVGKSRLATEFLRGLDATVVRGRCLSYGEGITLWPVVEALQALGVRPEDAKAATAIGAALGESDEPVPTDEIAWAVRKTFEQAARDRPVVVVWDDLHWAEPSFLDLVEHIADFSRGAPILLFCMARPELLDRRPGWAGGKLNATTVLLEPLSAEETDELIEELAPVDAGLRERIREAAEGNPLFVEEMLALVQDSGDGDVTVPPTIQALLAARLDQLEAPERAVLERGAVEGKVFHRGAVEALAPEEREVAQRLLALVRKELVRPDEATVSGDDAFRFRHLLIRDAAYDSLPKATRAELHRRFAGWLEQHGEGVVELDEIVGHHLEQAWRYGQELGQPDDAELREAARERLTRASWRAMVRADYQAARGLTGRALELVPDDEVDVLLQIDNLDALAFAGDIEGAGRSGRGGVDRARRVGNRVAELALDLQTTIWQGFVEPEDALERLEAKTQAALPELEASGDDVGLYVAYWCVSHVAFNRGRIVELSVASERSVAHAMRLPSPHHAEWSSLMAAKFWGPTPAQELLAWLEEQKPRTTGRSHRIQLYRAGALAMTGEAQQAVELIESLRTELRERGRLTELAMTAQTSSLTLSLAGDPERAERYLAEACAYLEEQGEQSVMSTGAALLALMLIGSGRPDEAEAWVTKALASAPADDVFTQLPARRARALLLSARGDHEAAERTAREALAIAEATDLLHSEAGAHETLAVVLAAAGDADEAAASFERAAQAFGRKGDVVSERRVREQLATATP
ncbi:MAG: adenylate/guanylate cyclase domain-containing protein [Gaiellaceae bacterium]